MAVVNKERNNKTHNVWLTDMQTSRDYYNRVILTTFSPGSFYF